MKSKLNGLQYLKFIAAKEKYYKANKPIPVKSIDDLFRREKPRTLEDWVEEEIGWRLKRIYDNISFFIRITIPDYFQRAVRGWGNSDTWNLDNYLSKVISQSVFHLRENVHGYPTDLKNLRQWKSILMKIVYTFHTSRRIGDTLWYIPSNKWTRKKYNATKQQFKNCKHLKIMTKKQVLKYEEGWMLFQKYFRNLWD